MRKLFLFDIDYTLIRANGIGGRAMSRVLEQFCGTSDSLQQIKMSGMCDWDIWRQALAGVGYSQEEADAQLPDLYSLYLAELAELLASPEQPDPEVLPGVRPLLEALEAREGVLLGLLTGNVEAAAWLKLGKVGLDRFFRFGAFGHEAADRSRLPALAIERASRQSNGHRFEGKDIVILGDTIFDIRCGAAHGVCAVGVATGRTDADTLRAAGADYVFDSFADHEAVLETLLGERG